MARCWISFCMVAIFLMLSPVCFGDEPATASGLVVRFDFEQGNLQGWQQLVGVPQSLVRPIGSVGAAAKIPEAGRFIFRTWSNRPGIIESPVFELMGNEATFLLGGSGGLHAYIALHSEDGLEILRTQVPVEHPSKGDPWKLVPQRWDLSEQKGRRVFLRVVAEPVGYSTGKRPGSGSIFQDSYVVLDAFQTPGQIDPEATARRAVQREKEKTESLNALADQVDEIIFAVRKADRDPHWYANIGHWAGDPERRMFHDGAKLCRLNTKTGELTVLLDDPKGGIRDPQVHYDAQKILFSYRPGGTEYYHLFEINKDGTNLRRLTDGTYDDIEATYMPDGNIMFISTRCKRWVPCYFTEVATLHRCDGDGKNIRVLSSNVEHENTPWPLPDGRIMYTRWEYVERSVLHFHHLWTTNPDGTRQAIFYGNARPGYVMIDAKPIPGTQKVVSVFCPGHGRTEHAGTITVVDPALGPDEKSSIQSISWTFLDRDPYPIGQDGFLVANTRNLHLMNYRGQVRRIYALSDKERDEGFQVHEPRPLVARKREQIIPPAIRPEAKNGRLFLADIYHGRNMEGVPRGSIKKLLVLEYLPKSLNMSNGSEPTSTVSNSLERILGTVPVEPDGSAYFEVPALRTIFLAALDERDMSVKRMQSFLTVQPGEMTGCVGCHEHRTQTPKAMPTATIAMSRRVSQIEPIEGIPSVFDFPRDIQPILDRHCVACHDWVPTEKGGPYAGRYIFSGDHGPVWSHSYRRIMSGLVFLSRGPGSGLGNMAPYSIGSSGSRIMTYLDGSHHDAKLSAQEQKMIRCWIDSGAIYAGTNAAEGTGMIYSQLSRQPKRFKVNTYSWFSMGERWEPSLAAAREVVERRCNGCHQHSLPELDLTRDMQQVAIPKSPMRRVDSSFAFNLTHPERSLLVLGPLSKEQGGMNRCGAKKSQPPVFADKNDPDYKTLMTYLDVLHEAQNVNKRFNMAGFKPSEHYVREMKRYGIIPESFDREKDEIDVYEADEAYWRSFWWEPGEGH